MQVDEYGNQNSQEKGRYHNTKEKIHTSSFSIVWPRGIIIWLPVNLVALIPEKAYEPAFKAAAE